MWRGTTDHPCAPYLAQIVNGQAVVLDYGIQNADGNPAVNFDGHSYYYDLVGGTANDEFHPGAVNTLVVGGGGNDTVIYDTETDQNGNKVKIDPVRGITIGWAGTTSDPASNPDGSANRHLGPGWSTDVNKVLGADTSQDKLLGIDTIQFQEAAQTIVVNIDASAAQGHDALTLVGGASGTASTPNIADLSSVRTMSTHTLYGTTVTATGFDFEDGKIIDGAARITLKQFQALKSTSDAGSYVQLTGPSEIKDIELGTCADVINVTGYQTANDNKALADRIAA